MRNRSRRTEGATLVVSVLFVMVLLMVILGVTAQVTLSSRRTTADQQVTLQTQYAAESGVAAAQARLKQVQGLMAQATVDQLITPAQLLVLFNQFCGTTNGALSYSATVPADGVKVCEVPPSSTNYSGAASAISSLIPSSAYTGTNLTSSVWSALFSASGSSVSGTPSTKASFSGSVELVPVNVMQMGPLSAPRYLLNMKVGDVNVTGSGASGSTSSRTVNISTAQSNFALTISKPAFSQFAQFRNQTTATTGGNLYFSAGETFNGPVHTNASLNLSGTSSSGPVFNDQVSTASTTVNFSGGMPCTLTQMKTAGGCSAMFTDSAKPLQTGVSTIPLPTNNNNQLRAALGDDPSVTAAVDNATWLSKLGLNSSSITNGVYYSKALSGVANASTSWMGGIYIKGGSTATGIKLSTTGSTAPLQQVITVTQGSIVTTFQQNTNGTWGVYVGGTLQKTLGSEFNGMIYVDGPVNLTGGGTTSPDVANNSQLTIATTGDMKIQGSVTYADNPVSNPSAKNVLGLFSSGGSILLDGPQNEDLYVNASVLASTSGEGFGSVNAGTSRGSVTHTDGGTTQPRIYLTGGVIEDQSQTVSSNGGGYLRKYTYDPRFRTGFSPPYFPLQQRWTAIPDALFTIGGWRQGP